MIFFEGYTNSSGNIEGITLPAPRLDINNLDKPNKTVYNIEALYLPDNTLKTYSINIYENVLVIQNISILPKMDMEIGGI